jgi:hypothetical protein
VQNGIFFQVSEMLTEKMSGNQSTSKKSRPECYIVRVREGRTRPFKGGARHMDTQSARDTLVARLRHLPGEVRP